MSQPPGQPQPPFGIPPDQYPGAPRNGRWPRRHPVWSAVIAAAALLGGIVAAAQPKAAPASHHAATAAAGRTAGPAAGCYPTTDSGNCYEPGEFCRDSDHGMSGIAGDGERIVCEDNDGWRWEPA